MVCPDVRMMWFTGGAPLKPKWAVARPAQANTLKRRKFGPWKRKNCGLLWAGPPNILAGAPPVMWFGLDGTPDQRVVEYTSRLLRLAGFVTVKG